MATEIPQKPAHESTLSYLDAVLIQAIGVPVYTTDTEGRITLYNDAALEMWGRRPVPGRDLWCGSFRMYTIDGEPLPHDQCPMAIAVREGRPVRGMEILVEKPDGSRAFVLPFPTPLRDKDGRLLGAVNVFIDITERKKAEQASLFHSSIVESSDDAIVSKDLDGIITSWNKGAERIFGYTADDMVGQSIRMLIPPDRQAEEDRVLETVGRGERIDHFETVRRRKDGTTIDVSLTVSPVVDECGRIIGVSRIAREITAQKKAQAAVEEALAAKDEFLSLVSHEMRTPITTIYGNASLLLKSSDRLTEEQRLVALEDVKREAARLQRTIEDLLTLARPEGDEHIALEPIMLHRVVDKLASEYMQAHPSRRVELAASCRDVVVQGNLACIELVVTNLLSNADKYSPAAEPIEVTLEEADHGLRVAVLDRGLGIGPSEVEAVFRRFYRSKTTANHAPGLGIGLAVCRRLVEAQGGRLWYEPRPGGGSAFIFTLTTL